MVAFYCEIMRHYDVLGRGVMQVNKLPKSRGALGGYGNVGTIQLQYFVPDGIQVRA